MSEPRIVTEHKMVYDYEESERGRTVRHILSASLAGGTLVISDTMVEVRDGKPDMNTHEHWGIFVPPEAVHVLRDYLALALRREDADTLFFTRRIVIEGDTALGLEIRNALDALG